MGAEHHGKKKPLTFPRKMYLPSQHFVSTWLRDMLYDLANFYANVIRLTIW